LHVLLCM